MDESDHSTARPDRRGCATDLRRRRAGIIEDALKSGAVVFVTQSGVAMCVLLAHKQYAALMEDSESARQAQGGANGVERGRSGGGNAGAEASGSRADPGH